VPRQKSRRVESVATERCPEQKPGGRRGGEASDGRAPWRPRAETGVWEGSVVRDIIGRRRGPPRARRRKRNGDQSQCASGEKSTRDRPSTGRRKRTGPSRRPCEHGGMRPVPSPHFCFSPSLSPAHHPRTRLLSAIQENAYARIDAYAGWACCARPTRYWLWLIVSHEQYSYPRSIIAVPQGKCVQGQCVGGARTGWGVAQFLQPYYFRSCLTVPARGLGAGLWLEQLIRVSRGTKTICDRNAATSRVRPYQGLSWTLM